MGLARIKEFYVFFSKISHSKHIKDHFWVYFKIIVIQNIMTMIMPKKLFIDFKNVLVYFSYIANFIRIT